MSERIPLHEGYKLKISNDSSSPILTIKKVIGFGGSCIVYEGIKTDPVNKTELKVVIKEFYPESLELKRVSNDDKSLDVTDCDVFEEYKEHFCDGQKKHILYYEKNQDKALPSSFLYINANNTIYSVAESSNGTTLSQIDHDSLSLNSIASIMEAICTAIKRIHSNQQVYLDCKPDNFFYYGSDYDIQKQIYLFDFDTCISIEDIMNGNYQFCSASLGWAPEEQEIETDFWGRVRYKNAQQIGYHTDIYSIGAIFFWLLTQRKPTESDLDAIQAHSFDWANESNHCVNREPDVYGLIKKITETTLQPSVEKRSEMFNYDFAINDVRENFIKLYGLTVGDNKHFEPIHTEIRQQGNRLATKISSVSSNINDLQEKIEESHISIEETIQKNSLKHFLFGTKRRSITTIITFLLILTASVTIGTLINNAINKTNPTMVSEIDQGIDEHVLLKLSNANHQYEVGIENWKRQEYSKAERDIKDALNDIGEETSQSEIEMAKLNNSLGCLYLDMGKYKDAYDYLNSAYVTFRNQLGEKSIESRAARASISQYYYFIGDLDEALIETQYILDNSDETTEKAVIARTSHIRAMIYDDQGNYDEALSLYDKVLDMYSDISSDGKLSEDLSNYANDPNLTQSEKENYTNSIRWIILTYSNIAKVNIHKEDYATAIEAANKGLEMALSNDYIGKKNITTSKLYMNLAIAQGRSGDVKTALENIDLAQRIQSNIFDFEDVFPGLVEIYTIYGDLLMMKEDYSEAEEYYNLAENLAIELLGKNHPDTASAMDSLGIYKLKTGNPDTAIKYLKEAVEIRKNILAENHPVTAKIYYDLAMAQIETGDKEGAKDSLTRAKDICDKWSVKSALYDDINHALEDN